MTLDPRTIERSELEGKLLPELQRMAQSLGVTGSHRLRKGDLIAAIIERSDANGDAAAPATVPGAAMDAAEGRSAHADATSENGQVETAPRDGGDAPSAQGADASTDGQVARD